MNPRTKSPSGAGVTAAMVLALFMVVMDNSVLNVALPELSAPDRGLAASVDELQWIVNAYVLSFAAFIFAWTVVAARLGERRSFLLATTLFGVFSLLAVASSEPWMLILFRALMGLAAAGIQPASLSIITSNVSPEARPRAIGLWSAGAGLAVAAGPVIGGTLLELFTWHSIFLLNLPIVALLIIATLIMVPRQEATASRPAPVMTIAILMAGMLLLVLGITQWGENVDSRGIALAIAAFGLVCCGLFFLTQSNRDTPVMPVSMLFGRRTVGSTVSLGMGTLLLMGNVFLMMLFLQLVQGRSALSAGYVLLPVAIAQLIFSPLAAAATRRIPPRLIVSVGFALILAAFVGYGSFNRDTATWTILVLFFLHGVGTALVVPVSTSCFMGEMSPHDAQYASAANTAIRQLSTALGVALFGAISSALYQQNINSSSLVNTLRLPDEATRSITATLSASGGSGSSATVQSLVELAKNSFTDALGPTFLIGAAFAALGLIAALLIPPPHIGLSCSAELSAKG